MPEPSSLISSMDTVKQSFFLISIILSIFYVL